MAKWGPILIGAAIGAGTSAVMGNDPLKGALMGGVGGAIGATDFTGGGSMFDSMGSMIGDVTVSGASGGGAGTAGGLFGMTTGQTIAAGLGGAGLLATAGSQAQEGLNTEAQAKFQAQLDQQLGSRKEEEADQFKRDYLTARAYDTGTQRSLLGRSGGNPFKGSLLNVQSDYAGEVAYQAAKISNQGVVTRTRLENQAALTRMSGASARQAGFQRAGGTVLLGGAQMASNFFV